ncbi:LysR family transcriptional regulator [Pantoea cypripedii]|uniref:LysR family transcriptional regulator n=1 Tax=Pantoea cypripedii TaxID=55209 RepID=A0A1X1EL76_PANCY|nr:LysR family transcriptional regulator [Pantoea cypripedii]MBP2200024.1 DNA-binding transcriptional LysR family regulator [Pantoea cypripedii]ORM89636.1 LysR family transcriptional regulator [Pantoea cypripedii]
MSRDNLNDLVAFITVAREQSFTRAAAALGVSQSALSHSMKALESRLGLRLLTRTTRSVSPTEAGERLLQALGPKLDEIKNELDAVLDLRDNPTGVVRVTATDYAITYLVWPKLEKFLPEYPDIQVELITDYGLTDIVAGRFDAGIRLGETVAQGMISVRISDDVRFVVVGSPDYFQRYPTPLHPRDLVAHRCINLRLPTHGGLYAWEFEKEGEELRVRVEGPAVFNNIFHVLDASVSGFGLAHVPEDLAAPLIAEGKLVRVLEDWCPYWDGYHLYYPSRRAPSRAFTLMVDALRYRRK